MSIAPMGSKSYVLGVDGGTESLRAAIFDLQGNVIGSANSPYETHFPHPSWAEQSPDDWWQALGKAVRKAVANAGISPEQIAAMSVDTTNCTVVALRADGSPLRPALLWMDMRSSQQAARVAATGDEAVKVNSNGAGPVSAEWMVPKALWLKQNEREVYHAAAYICEYQDYINFHLTGRMCASVNNASVRWHYSTKRGYCASLLAKLDLSELLQKWPNELLPLGEPVGWLTAAAAQHLGLAEGLLVAQGGSDAFIGMIGLGVIRPGQMALLTGSSHLQLGMVNHEVHGQGIFGTYEDAVIPGLHVIEGGQTSTGSIINWFRRNFLGSDVSFDTLNAEAARAPPGCEGLVCLDHFQGNRTPHTDPLSRGVLAGLTLKHGRGHVFRALMESIAFGTELILDTMRSQGFAPESITVAGGAAKSDLWMQIHADVSNLPLVLPSGLEAPMLGCAILAAVAAGLYPDIPTAVEKMVHVHRVVQPNPAAHEQYIPHYKKYCSLYPALKPLFHGMPAEAAKDGSSSGSAATAAAALNTASPAAATASTAAASSSHAAVSNVGTSASITPSNDASCAALTSTTGTDAACPPHATSSTPSLSKPSGLISPSILAADFANLAAEVAKLRQAGAQWVHCDMFDGSEFCPSFTIGPCVIKSLRRHTDMFLDCHLAIDEPAKYIQELADAGASSIAFHIEAVPDVAAAAQLAARIRALGMCAAVALAPETAAARVVPLVEQGALDMVLCMTVKPGFGGQKFMPEVLSKVSELRSRFPSLNIQVDGGINVETAVAAAAAGANVLVAGTAVYNAKEGPAAAIASLQAALQMHGYQTPTP